jgi:hypothetical protein
MCPAFPRRFELSTGSADLVRMKGEAAVALSSQAQLRETPFISQVRA